MGKNKVQNNNLLMCNKFLFIFLFIWILLLQRILITRMRYQQIDKKSFHLSSIKANLMRSSANRLFLDIITGPTCILRFRYLVSSSCKNVVVIVRCKYLKILEIGWFDKVWTRSNGFLLIFLLDTNRLMEILENSTTDLAGKFSVFLCEKCTRTPLAEFQTSVLRAY